MHMRRWVSAGEEDTTTDVICPLRRTCRTTVNSSRTWDVDLSGLPTSTRVSCPCRRHSHRLGTGVSL